jgi:hypothetical protein
MEEIMKKKLTLVSGIGFRWGEVCSLHRLLYLLLIIPLSSSSIFCMLLLLKLLDVTVILHSSFWISEEGALIRLEKEKLF